MWIGWSIPRDGGRKLINKGYSGAVNMENIFYAALALHVAGKPVNKENIETVLRTAGTPVNEPALDAMAGFVESLERACRQKETSVDPRIIKLLTSELDYHKVRSGQLEALIEELTGSTPSASRPETRTPETAEETSAVSERLHPKEAAREAVNAAKAAPVQEKPPMVEEEMPGVSEPLREEVKAAKAEPVEEFGAMDQDKGRYVYGIAASKEAVRLGKIGIEDNEVYTLPYKDLCAIIHNCPTEPYKSDDETVKGWVKTHQGVLDKAKEQLGPIIPLGFDTILQPQDDATPPDQVVKDWLKEDYERLRAVMEKIKGKDEYGVQILYEPEGMRKQLAEQNEEIMKIKEEMATKSPGMAYMYKQKLENAAKAEMDKLADDRFNDFYTRIKQYADDIVVEKVKKAEKDKVMLLNLSCLVFKEKVESLGEELEKIDNMEGFSVRFTGPWPPYSFVAQPVAEGQ